MPKKEAKFWIERSNEFNELRPKSMSLTEVRFLAIYQAKINARNPEKRDITFPLNEFMRIMDIKQVNTVQIKKIADSLICKPVHIPDGNGGLFVVPLFNKCHLFKDETGEWSINIRCSEEVMPYMFEMKRNYFKYQLWNALRLTSVNQIRMYELLKQYEKVGTRIIEIDELKEMLGIDKKQYARYNNFRAKVLEPCQKALEENTDIKFEYIPIRKSRKITAIKFNIFKNKNYKDILQLDEFIDDSDLEDIKEETKQTEQFSDEPQTLEDLYKKYFSFENEKNFKDNIKMMLGDIYKTDSMINKRTDAIYKQSVVSFKMQAQKMNIKKPAPYMQGIINNLISEEIKNPKKEKERSYDISKFEKFAVNYSELQEIDDAEKNNAYISSETSSDELNEKAIELPCHISEKPPETITEPENSIDIDDTNDEQYNEFFKTSQEEIELCMKMMKIIKKFSDYNETIEFLDIVDSRWRNLEGFYMKIVVEELAKKENAPELIEI